MPVEWRNVNDVFKRSRNRLRNSQFINVCKGEGVVIDEPSVVAIDAETKKCLAAGQDAKDMLGRTPGRVLAIRPLKDGVIADFEVTEIMLNFFFKSWQSKECLNVLRF